MKIFRGGSENLYTSKPTHDIIIQIGWFSTQQFNDLCNSAISHGLQIIITNVVSVIITLLFIPKML